MSVIEFLSHLRNLGVELQIHEDHLRLNAPKGVLTPALTEEVKLRKEEILAFLKSGAGKSGTAGDEITPVDRAGPIPMSFSQERLWFLDQLEPGNSTYNLPIAVRLRGNLNLACLQQVLNEIMARHEILRTNFDIVDNQPVQIITPYGSLPLTIRDLGELSPSEQIKESKRLIEEELQRPFDLRKDRLVRATLLKLNDEDHVFTLTFHHIVSDGWSRAVFAREFLALYEAFVEGYPNPLTPLPIQYADFASWQRKFLEGERLETQLAYWKGQLSGDLPQMDMLLDKPRPATLSHHSQHIGLIIPSALSQKLNELSQAEGATLFMT